MATQTNNSGNSPSGWVGWGYFAGYLMMLSGILQGINGLTAIFKKQFFVVTPDHLIAFNITTWGWVHLILGIVIFMAGLELLRGAMWARVVAAILAILSFAANMAFISAYPWWSVIVMVIDVLILYAVTVRGGELKNVD
ncbi:hypothetical protein EYC58_00140 [Candidatus Saccharibacteria bacterium]|nr:MAG: hypothetical protein EYC58_00140 [Candidatus Saccharibacteria bacterium]